MSSLSGRALVLCLIWLGGASSFAASVADLLEDKLAVHDAARAVQSRIDALSGQRISVAATLADQRLAEELAKTRQRVLDARERNASLTASVKAKRDARAGMMPLLEQMLDLLDQSIAADLPFDREARSVRVANARQSLYDSSRRMTDRFDAVLKVYQDELRYGYQINTGRETVQLANQTTLVNIVKLGRVGLYAVDDAAAACYVFAQVAQSWVALHRRHCQTLSAALDAPTLGALSGLPLSVAPP